MIGVILWTPPQMEKAVIWCEDRGEIALWSHVETADGTAHSVEIGDVVEFDLCSAHRMRRAVNLRPLRATAGKELIDRLRYQRNQHTGLSRAASPSREMHCVVNAA